VALLGKGTKAAAAVAVVGVLSVIFIVSDLTTEDYRGFVVIYGIGAAAGLAVSVIASIQMKRKVSYLRLRNFVLTLGVLAGGAYLLMTGTVSEWLVGRIVAARGILMFNYALGYFMVGVTVDALRVRRILKSKQSKK
jgi:hypothetical protein